MKHPKAFAGLLACVATTGIGLTVGLEASAHTARAEASCQGLSVSVQSYPEVVITGTVDGQTQVYRDNITGFLPWSETEAHTWSVTVDSPDDRYDRSFGGTQQACVT